VDTEQRITLAPTAMGLRHIEHRNAGALIGRALYGKVSAMPMPEEIVGLLRSKISFKWPDGHVTSYAARDLRLACRCAACVEETSGRPLLDPAAVPASIRANHMELMGQYAVSITWSDGHSTGIFNFRDLRANCPCDECAALRARGQRPV
jgi:DUF971 family protein